MGSRIRTARQFRRLTGEQLAEKIGIAVDSLRHIENGVRSPSFQLIERISDILDVSLDYLAGKTDSPLEHRVRKELENSGLTKEQEDAIVELALNSIPIIKKHI
jgi:transcriptional regulator, XRE family